jgi:glutathione S-transferase
MTKISITGFRWAPPFAQGLVRDLRVRWALEEAGLPYELHAIEIADLTSAAHLQKHPFGMVPTFESGGRRLFESGAIIYRLAEDCEALMPTTRDARSDTLAWMFAALSTVEPPLFNLFAMDQLHGQEPWAKLGRSAALEPVKARLDALSRWLDGRDYVLDRFTAADVLMVTALRFIRHTDLVAQFPVVDAYVKRCEARPAFQKALRDQLNGYARNAPAAA